MSLLNQVLQDLEKRNAEQDIMQNQGSEIKTVADQPKSSFYFLLVLFCVALIVVFIAFGFLKEENTDSVIEQDTLLAKIPAKLKTSTLPKLVPLKKTKTTLAVKPAVTVKKPEPSQQKIQIPKIIDEQKPVSAAAIVSQAIRKPLAKPIDNKQKAKQLFTSINKQQNKANLRPDLELILKLNPEHLKARLFLANTLMLQGLANEAASVLDQGLKLFPQSLPLINLRSQLYLQKKQATAALLILQNIDFEYQQDEAYLSLLAVAYQQNNENLKSLASYQSLIIINPQQAKYWLGLAVAWEKQGNKSQALNAYQQALNKNTLKASIVSYIRQRIAALN